MTDDEVGGVALGFQAQQGVGDRGTARGARGIVRGEVISIGGGWGFPAIVPYGNDRRALVTKRDERKQIVRARRLQGGGGVQELAGKVLVEEEDAHGLVCVGPEALRRINEWGSLRKSRGTMIIPTHRSFVPVKRRLHNRDVEVGAWLGSTIAAGGQ